MRTLANLATRLNWQRAQTTQAPRFYLLSDPVRLPDPSDVLTALPGGSAIVLRHDDHQTLGALAARIVPLAHRLGLKVLLSNDVRLALRMGCDGVHLSQRTARRGPVRIAGLPTGFLITAAAHDGASLRRAYKAGADAVLLSPVFPTASHLKAKGLGVLRFARLGRQSELPVIALGGVSAVRLKRLSLGPAFGIAAIGGWFR